MFDYLKQQTPSECALKVDVDALLDDPSATLRAVVAHINRSDVSGLVSSFVDASSAWNRRALEYSVSLNLLTESISNWMSFKRKLNTKIQF
jgi:hypothetical protein